VNLDAHGDPVPLFDLAQAFHDCGIHTKSGEFFGRHRINVFIHRTSLVCQFVPAPACNVPIRNTIRRAAGQGTLGAHRMIPTIGIMIAVYAVARLLQVPLEQSGWPKRWIVLLVISVPAIGAIALLAADLVMNAGSQPTPRF
jgi:hypothetical protein